MKNGDNSTILETVQMKKKFSIFSLPLCFYETNILCVMEGKVRATKTTKNKRYQITLKLFTDFKDYEKKKDF